MKKGYSKAEQVLPKWEFVEIPIDEALRWADSVVPISNWTATDNNIFALKKRVRFLTVANNELEKELMYIIGTKKS